MAEERLKSAYELAMERFQKKDAEAGIERQPVTEDQKAEIAEVRSRYRARIAELEILHKSATVGLLDPVAREEAEANYRQERGRLERDRDTKIEEIRTR